MATVTFNGDTLWADTSNAGVGAVSYIDRPLENGDMSRAIPRGYGGYLKAGPRGPVLLPVGFIKQFSAQSGEATFRAALQVIIDARAIGTLTVTGHTAVTNCRLVSAEPQAPTSPFQVGSTTYQIQPWFLIFERMR